MHKYGNLDIMRHNELIRIHISLCLTLGMGLTYPNSTEFVLL